ncbi:hypothetical protein GCK72_008677 [Caenorhabditis remanei]|uniref:F-box domain-containing protein n=1 Tax=Caenorhabditis remanei TaxID=31234 RepID=A0A6A5GY73_CAERE|nr:hypothetical protein GCK72_008677 [Caenorhabditis remanei]KAF1760428.1 hypothetical protein GCK72_008677 [Caenorhabditis remanei]
MTTCFPLLNLPPETISHVLKSMNINEFITLSFLSKRAKLLVEAMELKIPNVIVQLFTDFLLYDIDEIKATVGNFDMLLLSRNGIKNKGYDLLVKHFVSRCLVLGGGVFECLEHPKEVLIQNYDELRIISEGDMSIILDDLLMINSKIAMLEDVNWTGKEVNQFIKHWIKGSNPRLETLDIFSRGEAFNRTIALKGIRYKEIPANHVRKFKTLHQESLDVEGGYDIIRHDGTTATVTFDYDEGFDTDSLKMHVWHPHCVGDS